MEGSDSDSDQFESADENLSDNESSKTVTNKQLGTTEDVSETQEIEPTFKTHSNASENFARAIDEEELIPPDDLDLEVSTDNAAKEKPIKISYRKRPSRNRPSPSAEFPRRSPDKVSPSDSSVLPQLPTNIQLGLKNFVLSSIPKPAVPKFELYNKPKEIQDTSTAPEIQDTSPHVEDSTEILEDKTQPGSFLEKLTKLSNEISELSTFSDNILNRSDSEPLNEPGVLLDNINFDTEPDDDLYRELQAERRSVSKVDSHESKGIKSESAERLQLLDVNSDKKSLDYEEVPENIMVTDLDDEKPENVEESQMLREKLEVGNEETSEGLPIFDEQSGVENAKVEGDEMSNEHKQITHELDKGLEEEALSIRKMQSRALTESSEIVVTASHGIEDVVKLLKVEDCKSELALQELEVEPGMGQKQENEGWGDFDISDDMIQVPVRSVDEVKPEALVAEVAANPENDLKKSEELDKGDVSRREITEGWDDIEVSNEIDKEPETNKTNDDWNGPFDEEPEMTRTEDAWNGPFDEEPEVTRTDDWDGPFDEEPETKKTNDGWDDFEVSDNEDDQGIATEVQKPIKTGKEPANKDGWDDFEVSDHKCDQAIGPSVQKPMGNTEEKPVSKDGWDDFEVSDNEDDQTIGSTVQKPMDNTGEKLDNKDGWDEIDDNWDDWGDEQPQTSKETVEPAKPEQEWKGWDNFGAKTTKDSWGWSSWGVNSIISTASAVTQGLSNVLETGLGVPDPETLAAQQLQQKQNNVDETVPGLAQEEVKPSGFGISNLATLVPAVTHITKIVEHTKVHELGSKVISGGLDTLENIGKKTMEVLQEGDPGLLKKRAMLRGDSNKPVLSQILKEAKEKSENQDKKFEEKISERKCQFEWLFDDFQGLVHLEALEMLSKQCELKLEQAKNNLSTDEIEEFLDTLDEVTQLCDFEGEEIKRFADFRIALLEAVLPLQDILSIEKILKIENEVDEWLVKSTLNKTEVTSGLVQQKAVSAVAELTAATTQQFHKVGELLLIKERRQTVQEADTLLQMTEILCTHINHLTSRFATLQKSLKPEPDPAISQHLFVEAENATSYVKQAFTLLIPVLQLGAI